MESEVPELQSEDYLLIVEQKAKAAFEINKNPVVVTDDCWEIPELGGFPGPYMKSLNHYLTVDQLLAISNLLSDKTINLIQNVAYYDGHRLESFTAHIQGRFLESASSTPGAPITRIVTLEDYRGAAMVDVVELPDSASVYKVWGEFSSWYKSHSSNFSLPDSS